MTSRRILAILALALFAAILTACELSASTPPPSSPTSDSAMSTLQAELGNIATQTAAAGGGIVIPAATPTAPAEAGETPAPTEAEAPETPEVEPPPATPIVVPTATPGLPKTYELQKGEFPFCIARRFNLDPYELLSLNGLTLDSRPQVGFALKIPQDGKKFGGDRSLRDHPATYTVAAGDTIYTIACAFGDVDPLAIAQANGLESPYELSSGQKLNIP